MKRHATNVVKVIARVAWLVRQAALMPSGWAARGIARAVVMHAGIFSIGLAGCATALAQLSYVTPGDGRPLLIFVHGLGGSARSSFKAPGSDKSWPQLMQGDAVRVRGARPLREYATATLAFPAACADRVTIPQVAANLVRTLFDEGTWTRHPWIIFIGHSLGGLIVQEMLTTSQGNARFKALVDRTAGVVFLATPAGGSDHAEALAAVLEHVPGLDRTCPLLRDLRSIDGNTLLQKLDVDWRKLIQAEERDKGRERRLQSACLYETKSVFGVKIVGQNASAAICDERLAMNEDHLSIAKPSSRDSEIYQRVRGLIADIALMRPGMAASKLPGRSDLGLNRRGDLATRIVSPAHPPPVADAFSALQKHSP